MVPGCSEYSWRISRASSKCRARGEGPRLRSRARASCSGGETAAAGDERADAADHGRAARDRPAGDRGLRRAVAPHLRPARRAGGSGRGADPGRLPARGQLARDRPAADPAARISPTGPGTRRASTLVKPVDGQPQGAAGRPAGHRRRHRHVRRPQVGPRLASRFDDIHSAKLVLTDRLIAATRPLDASGDETSKSPTSKPTDDFRNRKTDHGQCDFRQPRRTARDRQFGRDREDDRQVDRHRGDGRGDPEVGAQPLRRRERHPRQARSAHRRPAPVARRRGGRGGRGLLQAGRSQGRRRSCSRAPSSATSSSIRCRRSISAASTRSRPSR